MAANTSPIFTLTPNITAVQVSVANTNRDGTGTTVTCFTAGTNGSRVERIRVKHTSTSTAGIVRIFTFDGANTRLLTELPITAITPSGTTATYESVNTLSVVLPTGWSLKASTHNAETINIIVEGGDF